jgi:hypothetical protein
MNYSYANGYYGYGGIVAGLRDAAAKPGSVARFEVVDHPAHGKKVYGRMGVGFELAGPDGLPSWRIAGENGKIDGTGSFALIPTWEPDQSLAAAACALAIFAMRAAKAGAENVAIFRIAEPEQYQAPAEVLNGDLNHVLDHLFGDVNAQLNGLGVRQ